ncbi:hypothetical protein WEN_03085 [Mycoplasma wenyonii str. Massachusetts]|uniref:Lipoprotein n=1 Tax=Mycoplasma wenyonii (strain Massachusetts) TaxID=1197325 RepID=I6Z703_MYCWM|nr:hypothetical protein [Mycoplasma wenyonii]AFN65398.1 hypothetical protein WEN_03085 [Mycoplasma wenyonii str. Massachusetts]
MSLSDEKKKKAWLLAPLGCLMAGTSCGIPFIPGVWGTKVSGIPYPRFVLGTSEGGQELHIVESGLLKNKGYKGEIPFDQVTMKWGYRQLTANDALISCKKEEYYVGRHIWENQYFLHNGQKFFWSENSCSSFQSDNGKSIKPNFEKKVENDSGGSGTSGTVKATKILLPIGTCKFKWADENDVNSGKKILNMNCDGYTNDEIPANPPRGGTTGAEQQGSIQTVQNYLELKRGIFSVTLQPL